jgi:hypothetical protein
MGKGIREYSDPAAEGRIEWLARYAMSLAFRGPSNPPSNGSWSQTSWFIDLGNSTGLANDQNNGLTASTPLLTKAGLAAKYLTWSPTLIGINVQVNYLGADTGNTDPSLFTPTLLNGATFTETAPLPTASFTGSLLSVTAKSGNGALQSTFTPTTGAIVAGMKLVNSSRANTVAFVQRSLGGGNFQITQPANPYAGGGATPGFTENNAWANGDTITGYVLPNVDFGRVGGINVDRFGAGHIVWNLTMFDPAGSGVTVVQIDSASLPYITECSIQKSVIVTGQEIINTNILGCDFKHAALSASWTTILGGGQRTTTASWFLFSSILGGDLICQGTVNFSGGSSNSINTGNGLMLDQAGNTLNVISGDTVTIVSPRTIYGAGKINVQQGALNYSGQTATQALPLTGGLQLNGVATGYSMATSGGNTTIHGGIALNVTNIDAAAGATGFGGTATNLAGASITNTTQP